MERKRLGVTIGGGIFVVTGGRLLQNIWGAGGNLVPPILAVGGLLILFGMSVVITTAQTRLSLRRLLGYEIVAGSVGLFAISGYVTFLAFESIGTLFPWRSTLASFFLMLGGAGMVLSVILLLLVKYNRR